MASRGSTAIARRGRTAAAAVTVAAGLLLTGCGGAAGTSSTSADPSASGTNSASTAPTPAPVTIAITMTGDSVSPNGQKIDATVGQSVVLQVTSDIADEVHAHTGGDGYELEVPAGKPTTGTFVLASPGSFEIESHHREKILAILNVR